MKKCKYCDWEGALPVAHLAECQFAPEEAREMTKMMLAASEKQKGKVTCCALRKKILCKPIQVPTELCGIEDSAVLDVATFDQHEGIDVITFRWCPWCGKPWARTGAVVS